MPDKRPPEYSCDPSTGDIRVEPRDGLLARQIATADQPGALDHLHQLLAQATVLYEHHADQGRVGACWSLHAVITYLVGQGIPYAALTPLSALLAAVEDARRGAQHPVTAPEVKVGAPGKLNVEIELEQHLAAVTEFCVRHLRRRGARPFVKPATELAAKLVNGAQLGITTTAAKLRELRERVSQLPPGDSGRVHFDILLGSSAEGIAPLECAKTLLSHDWLPRPLPQVSG